AVDVACIPSSRARRARTRSGAIRLVRRGGGGVVRDAGRMISVATTGLSTMEGGCHCSRVRFRVTAGLERGTACHCSACTNKGFLHLIVPPERFELLSGKDDLTAYQFNTGTAQHIFCKHCGIHPFYVPRSDPDKIDVNVRCLDDIDVAAISPKRFDGKNWE